MEAEIIKLSENIWKVSLLSLDKEDQLRETGGLGEQQMLKSKGCHD